jgi:hypothetical protein
MPVGFTLQCDLGDATDWTSWGGGNVCGTNTSYAYPVPPSVSPTANTVWGHARYKTVGSIGYGTQRARYTRDPGYVGPFVPPY